MEINWDQLWEEEVRENRSLCLAVLCTKCNLTSAVCNCAKEMWILQQKSERGLLTPEDEDKIPYVCFHCKKRVIDVLHSFTADTMKDEPICMNCIQKHDSEPRHLEAFMNWRKRT